MKTELVYYYESVSEITEKSPTSLVNNKNTTKESSTYFAPIKLTKMIIIIGYPMLTAKLREGQLILKERSKRQKILYAHRW